VPSRVARNVRLVLLQGCGEEEEEMMKKLAACVLLSLVSCTFTWAGPTAAAQAGSDIAGTYALESVNGGKLPFAMTHDGVTITIRAGSFVIKDDGTCSSRMTFVVPSGEEMTRDVAGTYTREGATLTITWAGAGTTTGTVEGKTFTMDNEGMVLVYRR
jgi:hypothetical protein